MCGWVGGDHCIYVQLTYDVYLHQALTESMHSVCGCTYEDFRNQGDGLFAGVAMQVPPTYFTILLSADMHRDCIGSLYQIQWNT